MMTSTQTYLSYALVLFLLIGISACGSDDQQADGSDLIHTSLVDSSAVGSPGSDTAGNATESGAETTATIDLHREPHADLGDLSVGCSFRSAEEDWESDVLISNMESHASMTINGDVVLFKGGRSDDNGQYEERGYEKEWIVLNENGEDLLFGEKIDYTVENWQEMLVEELTHVLALMDELPESVPVTSNGTVGMGHRGAMRDLGEDALAAVRKAKAQSAERFPYTWRYESEKYEVHIMAVNTGVENGSGPQYAGELVLTDRKGRLLQKMDVWGLCGC